MAATATLTGSEHAAAAAAVATVVADAATSATTETTTGATTDSGATDATTGKTPAAVSGETAETSEATRTAAADAAKAPVTYSLTMPEGASFGPEFVAYVEADARAAGLSNAQAELLWAHRVAEQQQLRDGLADALKKDPELGGANLPQTQRLALAGRDHIFPAGTKGAELIVNFLEASGFGNHPEIVREFARIGRAISEDTAVARAATGTTPTKRSHAEVLFGNATS